MRQREVCLHLSRREETPILSDLAWSLDVLGQSVPELTLFRQTHEVVLPATLIGAAPLSDSVYLWGMFLFASKSRTIEKRTKRRLRSGNFRSASCKIHLSIFDRHVDATINCIYPRWCFRLARRALKVISRTRTWNDVGSKRWISF